jgi:signal transduction histidine kinase
MLFGRAVSNLVENALPFTSAAGTIQILIVGAARQSEISVRDNRLWDRRAAYPPGCLIVSIAQIHRAARKVRVWV